MTNKYVFDTLNRLFKDLCQNSKPFVDKVIIVFGDFRQTLPIVHHDNRAHILESSVKTSVKSGQEKRAERKIQERADWKKNLETWGSRTNRMHGRLRRKNAAGKQDTLDEIRGK